MKGSRAISEATEGTPEGMDLSLIGLPPPMSQHPSSASATKPIVRSVSIATGSEPRRKTLEATGPGGSRAINNLRRSNSTTQVNQPWTSSPRPAEPTDFLTLFEGSTSERRRVASLSKAPSEKGATWNILVKSGIRMTSPGALPCRPVSQVPVPSVPLQAQGGRRAPWHPASLPITGATREPWATALPLWYITATPPQRSHPR
ncbi:centrosomal protein of 131 kDa isoform X8 [Castor canadensis]|uniref:Centrosomal protein of 131 kDa isoform X8 n=1 Tax=Castor canadensis TaxID=51338 RepID=A0AC58K846_CASCN